MPAPNKGSLRGCAGQQPQEKGGMQEAMEITSRCPAGSWGQGGGRLQVEDQGCFVCFVYKKGSWILHFHSLPIEHPGYKRGPGWLLHPNPRSFLQSQQLRSSKSHGKWQWLGWAVAGESLGLGTQAPSVWPQLCSSAGGQFCSLAASTRSGHLQRGGTARIW